MIGIYVAGASSEMERARRAMDKVQACPNLRLLQDWVADIEAAGDANPADLDVAAGHADQDMRAAVGAHFFWFLLPTAGHSSRGAWWELGAWESANRMADSETPLIQRPELVISGAHPGRSIFLARRDHHALLDAEAFEYIEYRARVIISDVEATRAAIAQRGDRFA